MSKLTYIEARDKIWNAYFADEIEPWSECFCFCGTLCGNSSEWSNITMERHNPMMGYSGKDFVKMECALLGNLPTFKTANEDQIFEGMLAALEVLKNIHRERGDFIPEDEPLLTKRILAGKEKEGFADDLRCDDKK